MTDGIRIIDVKVSVFENNDRDAERLGNELKAQGVCLINLMSSPRAGIDALADWVIHAAHVEKTEQARMKSGVSEEQSSSASARRRAGALLLCM